MRFIHCADLHLDSRMTTKLSAEISMERRRELLETYERMISYAATNDIAGIIIAGDLFDTEVISDDSLEVVWNSILANSDIDFYYLWGNHEQDTFVNSIPYIPDNLKLFDESDTYITGDEGKIAITGIVDYQENDGIYDELSFDNDKVNIVVMHGQVYDNNTAVDSHAIHLPKLRNKGIDYLALGHIHSFRIEKLDARGVYCYSGCLEARGYDEPGEHGFVVLDVDEQEGIVDKYFVDFSKRKVVNAYVDISDIEDTNELIEEIDNITDNFSKEDMLNIVLDGNNNVSKDINLEYVLTKYSDIFYMARLVNKASNTFDYNEFMYDETLRGEFVRNVLKEDIDEEFKADIIKCGMLALGNKEVRIFENN